MVRIEKLIEQQEKRKQEFRKNIEVNPSAITITSVDEQLIQKCLEYIEKNMDNPEYGVEELSGDLGMVRMSLSVSYNPSPDTHQRTLSVASV